MEGNSNVTQAQIQILTKTAVADGTENAAAGSAFLAGQVATSPENAGNQAVNVLANLGALFADVPMVSRSRTRTVTTASVTAVQRAVVDQLVALATKNVATFKADRTKRIYVPLEMLTAPTVGMREDDVKIVAKLAREELAAGTMPQLCVKYTAVNAKDPDGGPAEEAGKIKIWYVTKRT